MSIRPLLWCTGLGNLLLRPVLRCIGEGSQSLRPMPWSIGEGHLSLRFVLRSTGAGNSSLCTVLWCTGVGNQSLCPLLNSTGVGSPVQDSAAHHTQCSAVQHKQRFPRSSSPLPRPGSMAYHRGRDPDIHPVLWCIGMGNPVPPPKADLPVGGDPFPPPYAEERRGGAPVSPPCAEPPPPPPPRRAFPRTGPMCTGEGTSTS